MSEITNNLSYKDNKLHLEDEVVMKKVSGVTANVGDDKGTINIDTNLNVNGTVKMPASEQFSINNPEYLQVTTDSDSKILQGIKSDGTSYIGGDLKVEGQIINPSFQEKIDSAVESMQQTITDNFSNIDHIVDNPDNTQVNGYLLEQSNQEWLQVTTDSEGRVLEGIKTNGEKVISLFDKDCFNFNALYLKLGLPKPNLLTLPTEDYSSRGITYHINKDGSITLNGETSDYNSYIDLSLTLNRGCYTLWGMPNDCSRSTWHFLVNPGGGFVPVAYLTNGYSFFVNEDNTLITLWIRVMKNTTVEDVTFYPVLSKQSWEIKDFILPEHFDNIRPLYEYVNTTDYGWAGKKMLLTGDSITDGGEGEGFSSFGDIVARILNLSYCRNYGIGGSSIASRTEQLDEAYPPVVNRWNDMEADADIIYIHAGTNDWSSQVPLGSADSQNPKEFNGALNIIMSGLKVKYPGKLIIFDTILNRIGYDSIDYGGVGTKPILTSQYSQCIIDKCKEYQLIYNDVYNNFGLDFKYDKEHGVNAITDDGLHPNNNGIRILGRKIASFICNH